MNYQKLYRLILVQEIKVAHLVLNENNQVADLYQSIEHLEVDLLSVQTPVGLVDDPSFRQTDT